MGGIYGKHSRRSTPLANTECRAVAFRESKAAQLK